MPTKFSFEVPLKHLEDFDEDQDFYFTLSFLLKKEEYLTFVKDRAKGRQIWVDNSTNELKTPDSTDCLRVLFDALNADFVIAPDHPDWNQECMLQTWLDLSRFTPKDKTICVVHHPDWIGHFESYGVRQFAVPYDFRYCTTSKLKRFSKCHFLGLLSVKEIKIAQPPSCDTSIPIKLAMQNRSLDEWVRAGYVHIHTEPNFFERQLTLSEVKLAKSNIKALRASLEQDDLVNEPRHYNKGSIEVLDFILDQKLPYLPGQVLKYICRYRFKGGLEDLKKAEYYLKKLIRECEDENSCSKF